MTIMNKATKKPKTKKNPIDQEALEAMDHIGQKLKAIRKDKNYTLEQVSKELMIRRFYLNAIENGEFKELPVQVYALGFIKNYADFLGYDSVAAIAEFKKEAYNSNKRVHPDLVFLDPMTTSSFPSKWVIIAAVVVVILLILGTTLFFSDNEPVILEIPEPVIEQVSDLNISEDQDIALENVLTNPDPIQVVPEDNGEIALSDLSMDPQQTLESEEMISEISSDPTVSVKSLQTSWVEIVDQNNDIVLSRILKADEVFDVPNPKGAKMITGNAGGIVVILNGQELPKFGNMGDVRRNISLSPSDLEKKSNTN